MCWSLGKYWFTNLPVLLCCSLQYFFKIPFGNITTDLRKVKNWEATAFTVSDTTLPKF